jgi:aldose 1-epimerase
VQLVDIASGHTRASIAPEAGGRIHQIEIHAADAWLPLLLAPERIETLLSEPLAWGSYAMAPWPGRIDGGRFLWEGHQYRVPVNLQPHSIHGRGVYNPWRVERRDASSCRMSIDFDAGWPFAGRAVQSIAIEDRAITQRIEIHARSGSRFPAGAGWHPWFRRDVRPGAAVRLRVDASRTYETTDEIPTGWLPPVQGETDLRAAPALGAGRLDTCYRHPQAPLVLHWGDIELTMTSSTNVTHAVVYTPEHAFCVEPQTCAPDAFNLAAQGIQGAGMAIVAPGRPLVATTTWRWRVDASSSDVRAPRR